MYPESLRRNATRSRKAVRASESRRHNPDIIGIRSQQHHAPELKAEIALRHAGRGGCMARPANKFHWIVLKMRQAQAFLATFESDHRGHENVGRYLVLGAAHDLGRRLYGPVADKRATGGSADELTLAVGAGVEANLGGQMLSVDQFLRLVSVPAVFLAFHIAAQVSGG